MRNDENDNLLLHAKVISQSNNNLENGNNSGYDFFTLSGHEKIS